MIERSVKKFSDAGPILDEMRSPYHGVHCENSRRRTSCGRGEQGLFHTGPYKNDLLPLYAL